jgi:hypothetical protein
VTTFNSMHIYIDESGTLAGELAGEDLRLVGGVVILSQDGFPPEGELHELLEESCKEVSVPFPEGLHGSSFRVSPDLRERFFCALSGGLDLVQSEELKLAGIAVRHNEDLMPATSIAGENSLDNRYKALLWTLLEHLLFVDYGTADQLAANPRIHLTVASRMWVDESGQYDSSKLRALGMSSRVLGSRSGRDGGRDERKLAVPGIIHESDLLTMLQMGVRNRWPERGLDITGVEVQMLDYKRPRSSGGLYLADLYLSSLRQSLKHSARPEDCSIIPTLLFLQYSRKSDALAEARRALDGGDSDGFMDQVPVILPTDTDYLQTNLGRMIPDLGAVFEREPDQWVEWWREAARRVDRPGSTEEGENLLEILGAALSYVNTADMTPGQNVRAAYYRIQARLSLANKRGDLDGAAVAWGEFSAMESALDVLGLEALFLRAVIRRNQAVSLMEHFRYDEALATVDTLIEEFAETGQRLQQAGLPLMGEDARRVLAGLHAAAGEVRCLKTPWAGRQPWSLWHDAENHFREALELSQRTEDQRRFRLFAGHMACDMGPAGAGIWEETTGVFPDLLAPHPVRGREHLDLLALQVKGLLVFPLEHEHISAYLASWRSEDPILALLPEERTIFPVGIILQDVGLLALKYGFEHQDALLAQQGRKWARDGQEALLKGGAMLQLMGHGVSMRLALLDYEQARPGSEVRAQAAGRMRVASDSFITLAQERWGDTLWSESAGQAPTGLFGFLAAGEKDLHTRCKALLGAFRLKAW